MRSLIVLNQSRKVTRDSPVLASIEVPCRQGLVTPLLGEALDPIAAALSGISARNVSKAEGSGNRAALAISARNNDVHVPSCRSYRFSGRRHARPRFECMKMAEAFAEWMRAKALWLWMLSSLDASTLNHAMRSAAINARATS